jgi:hypothetical protein
VIYLCTTTDCVRAEFRYSAARQGLSLDALLPRELWAVHLGLEEVLDLTDQHTLEILDVDSDLLVHPNHEFTQQLGEMAHEMRFQAIRSASATGVDDVVAVFIENLGQASMDAELIAEWASESDLEG